MCSESVLFMATNSITIRVPKKYVDMMMNENKERFLDDHPELKGTHITISQMFVQLNIFYNEVTWFRREKHGK